MANIKEAELFPITSKEFDYIRQKLAEDTIIDLGNFTTHGTFRVLEEYFWGQWNKADHMWSFELLGIDPMNHKIRASREGGIDVLDMTGKRVKDIYPDRVREINHRIRSWQIVGKSGYLLPLPDQPEFIGNHPFDSASLEELLVLAETGVRSRDNMLVSRYFAVRVDPSLAGTELIRLDFRFSYPNPKWVKDAVVIDPKTYQLVPRKIYHPFAPHRWEQQG